MLSDEEFSLVAKHSDTYSSEVRAEEESRQMDRLALFASGWLPTILAEFKRLTGDHVTNLNAIWHHQASIYGGPCVHCGKVLRTPVAKFCFLCHRYQDESAGRTEA
jgi:hypothetical protein